MTSPELTAPQITLLRRVAQSHDSRIRGVRAHAEELLEGRDPTGGMIDVGMQLAEIERQLWALDPVTA